VTERVVDDLDSMAREYAASISGDSQDWLPGHNPEGPAAKSLGEDKESLIEQEIGGIVNNIAWYADSGEWDETQLREGVETLTREFPGHAEVIKEKLRSVWELSGQVVVVDATLDSMIAEEQMAKAS
jgi:hypothetical protein